MEMTDRKIKIAPKWKHADVWNKLLDEWRMLVNCYCDGKDVPYWYGERALTGLLASAAWRLNGWALEEFSIEKGVGGQKEYRRGDLWLGLEGAEFTVEAKICYVQEGPDSAVPRIQRKLNEARRQLRTIPEGYHVGQPISICYVVPWFRVKKGNPNLKSSCDKAIALMDHLRGQFESEGCSVRHYVCKGQPLQYSGSAYPGVLLIARAEELPGWVAIPGGNPYSHNQQPQPN